jgi:hypothetical protein
MNTRNLWSRVLIIVGGIAMVVGATDLMEGSLLILHGSGMVALGTFIAQSERRLIVYRVWVFVLIAIGVGGALLLHLLPRILPGQTSVSDGSTSPKAAALDPVPGPLL